MAFSTLLRFLRIDTCSRNQVCADHFNSIYPEKLDIEDCLEAYIYVIGTLEYVRHMEKSSASVPLTESYERWNYLLSVVDMWLYFIFQGIRCSYWSSSDLIYGGDSQMF
jgi:hypothetical protein